MCEVYISLGLCTKNMPHILVYHVLHTFHLQLIVFHFVFNCKS
jgi:hypothetical protein